MGLRVECLLPWVLFHATTVEIAFIRCVLPDIGGLALLGSVLRLRMPHRGLRGGPEIIAGPFIAAIGWRYGWHVLGH